VVSTDYTGDINVSQELLDEYSNQLRKLHNSARFIIGNLYDYDGTPVEYSDLLDVDKYMLHLLAEYGMTITEYYQNYSFHKVIKCIFSFTNLQLSAFYFDIIKDRMYTSDPKSIYRRSAQFVLEKIYWVFTLSLAPILPHVCEDIHQHYPLNKDPKSSVYQNLWFKIDEKWNNTVVKDQWETLRSIKSHFNKLFEEKEAQRTRTS